jgi:uncharacterized protein
VNPNEIIIANTIQFVKKRFDGDFSGHDWWHVYRVWKMALYLAFHEGADHYMVQLAALLHDIADWKFNYGDTDSGIVVVKNWLKSQDLNNDYIKKICSVIETVSFKGAGVETPANSIEAKVVQDADRLDAMGAIGITRAFAYGGANHREIYNPDIPPVKHNSFEEYKKNQSTSINHFHEKLLHLKESMNTETAKHLAIERHHYMECFLDQFMHEWNINGTVK